MARNDAASTSSAVTIPNSAISRPARAAPPTDATAKPMFISALPSFSCPAGTRKRGKPPPEGTQMWCETKEGLRSGPYRRFPPSAAGVSEPTFVADGVVVGAAVMRRVLDGAGPEEVRAFLAPLRRALDQPHEPPA